MPCGHRGFPSEDGRTRRFTRNECYAMGGIPFPEGFCNYVDEDGNGGSFSNDCARLNFYTFDFFLRQPLWLQVGVGAGALYGGWRLINRRR